MESQTDLGLDRHLVRFDPRQVPLYRFDLVVVGGGAAGASAALAAAEQGASVALLSKADLQESNTLYAQGGLAAALDPADSFEQHLADTLRVGCGLVESQVARDVIAGGPGVVDRLVALGAQFDRRVDGSLDLSREGGHGQPRILHARGDATGLEIQETLSLAVQAQDNVTTFARTFAVQLLRTDCGRVCGVMAVTERGEQVGFLAGGVILATGGGGQLFRETTNPAIATGDGIALGIRVGAVVRDMEFFQFHPTCLYIAGAARVLISEIVRGAGGVLRDREGVRFMPAAHPDAELAPRDVVSRAVFERMVQTRDTSVYLDLSGIEGDPHALFPGISRICRFFAIDIARDPIPVRPGAHYMIGGLVVDTAGRTSVPGLWAVGECACTGLHGANRMGSNSLLEGLVLGWRAGQLAAATTVEPGFDAALHGEIAAPSSRPHFKVNIEDVTYSLKSLMWRQMGVEREGEGLRDALEKIVLWTRAVSELSVPGPRTWELLNMLLVSHLATLSALAREESRGVHWRSDFPRLSEAWRAHTELTPVLDGPLLSAIRYRRVPVEAEPAVL